MRGNPRVADIRSTPSGARSSAIASANSRVVQLSSLGARLKGGCQLRGVKLIVSKAA